MTPKQQELLRVRFEKRVLDRVEKELVEEFRHECDHPIRKPNLLLDGETCQLCGLVHYGDGAWR